MLVCDEITTALDPAATDLVRAEVERGATADLLREPRAEATRLPVEARDLGTGQALQRNGPPVGPEAEPAGTRLGATV